MSPTFTEDEIGKPVESTTGETLGVVAAVDPGTAYVDPGAGGADSSSTDDAVPLADDSVDRVTDESVRLDDEFQTESLAAGTESADEQGGRDVAYEPGETVSPTEDEPAADVAETRTDTEADSLEHSEPMMEDDGFSETAANDPRVDESAEPEPESEPSAADSPENERADAATDAEDLEAIEDEAGRELEVDPTELTDEDPEAEIEPGEDVGRRESADDVGGEADEPAGPSASDPEAVDTDRQESSSARADDIDEGSAVEDRDPEEDR